MLIKLHDNKLLIALPMILLYSIPQRVLVLLRQNLSELVTRYLAVVIHLNSLCTISFQESGSAIQDKYRHHFYQGINTNGNEAD